MADPEKSSGDFQKRRSGQFEPIDTRMWELTDRDPSASPQPRRPAPPWIVPGVIGLILIVVMALTIFLMG